QQQQQQSAARRTTKRTAKAKTAAAVLDNRLLIEGWVERSETHQARCNGLVDGFRSLRDSVRCANYAFASLGRCALPIYFEFLLAEGDLNQICGKIPPGSVAPGVCK
ncbi:MAG: hypothetical protein Q8J76_12595, partial [Desulfobulbaceae bacterium]|nr:hypothetical protein [Desulfobulbaceae bacterium]